VIRVQRFHRRSEPCKKPRRILWNSPDLASFAVVPWFELIPNSANRELRIQNFVSTVSHGVITTFFDLTAVLSTSSLQEWAKRTAKPSLDPGLLRLSHVIPAITNVRFVPERTAGEQTGWATSVRVSATPFSVSGFPEGSEPVDAPAVPPQFVNEIVPLSVFRAAGFALRRPRRATVGLVLHASSGGRAADEPACQCCYGNREDDRRFRWAVLPLCLAAWALVLSVLTLLKG